MLAGKLGLGEAEASEAFALGESFDQELAQLLLAPTDGTAGELLAELEAEAASPPADPLADLDRARATLAGQLADGRAGPTAHRAARAVHPRGDGGDAADPGRREDRRPRPGGQDFLAGQLATLIQGYVGPQAARALAPHVADAGLRLLSLEAEAPEQLGAEALVDTLQEAVARVMSLPGAALDDPLRLEAEADAASRRPRPGCCLPPRCGPTSRLRVPDQEGRGC